MNITKQIKVKEEGGKVIVEGVVTEDEFYLLLREILTEHRKEMAVDIVKDIKMLYG